MTEEPSSNLQNSTLTPAPLLPTTNQQHFLRDSTGSRRFIPIIVDNINSGGDFCLPQAIVQAKMLIEEGNKNWFNKKEQAIIEDYNLNFTLHDPEEELIDKYYSPIPVDNNDPAMLWTTTEIRVDLLKKANLSKTLNQFSLKKVGIALRKLGFERKTDNSRSGGIKAFQV